MSRRLHAVGGYTVEQATYQLLPQQIVQKLSPDEGLELSSINRQQQGRIMCLRRKGSYQHCERGDELRLCVLATDEIWKSKTKTFPKSCHHAGSFG